MESTEENRRAGAKFKEPSAKVFHNILSYINVSDSEFVPTQGFSFAEQIIYIWILASIAEEIFTRGLIQGFLLPVKHIGFSIFKVYISLPVIIAALFFGAMHLALLQFMDPPLVLNIVFFGIILGLIAGYYREKYNNLIPAILVHTCFNIGGSLLQIVLS